jgi:hypothetical protein
MVLAACGATEAPAPTEAPAAEPTEAPAAEPTEAEEPSEPSTGEGVTVTVAGGNVGQELELTKAAAQRYMDANPNVTVNVLDTPDFVQDRLGLYLQFFEAQSSEVDVYQIDVIWPGDLAEHFVDLYEYGAADVAANTSRPSSRTIPSTANSSACPGSPTPACSTTAPTSWTSTAMTAHPPPGMSWRKWPRPSRTASAPKATRTSGALSGRATPTRA